MARVIRAILFLRLFSEHGGNPYNDNDNYYNRNDTNGSTGFKNSANYGTAA